MFLVKVLALVLLQQYCVLSLEAGQSHHVPHASPVSRIIRGHDAAPHEVPSIVFVTTKIGNHTYACGGTLIHPRFVLTAAHCFDHDGPILVRAFLGCHKHDLSDCDQMIVASSYVIHEDYAKSVHKGADDIALFKLSDAAELKPRVVETAKLPQLLSPPRGQDLYDDKDVCLYGWGVTNVKPTTSPLVLQKLVGTIAPYSACSAFRRASTTTLCMTRKDGTLGVGCFGDSGGPLFEHGVQIGIVSGGAADCTTSPFTVFTRVDFHRQWIQETIRKM